jgi:periplasmic protein TonB
LNKIRLEQGRPGWGKQIEIRQLLENRNIRRSNKSFRKSGEISYIARMKITLTLLLSLALQWASAQPKNDRFYELDNDLKPTKPKKAAIYLRVRQQSETSFEYVYYQMYGPRIKMESFKDEKGTLKNGKSAYYYFDGTLDSLGQYANGKQDGAWVYLDKQGHPFRKRNYSNGVKIADTLIDQKAIKDTTRDPGDVESEYPGGTKAWQQYLLHNLHYPDRAVSAEVMGDVRLQFIVDKDGSVLEPEIQKSVEYSLDEEALRMITNSIKWTPAIHEGRNVKSYKMQPIRFRLEVQVKH